MEDKVFLDESGLGEVGKVIKEHYASKKDLSKIDVTEQLVDYVKKTEVPTKLSQFTNDKSFKTEDEIKKLINESNKLKKEIVTSLPSSGVDDVVYLLKNKDDSNNVCTEYLWINGSWEIIGDTQVDLTDYAKKTDLENKVDKIDGKSLSSNDYTSEDKKTVERLRDNRDWTEFMEYYNKSLSLSLTDSLPTAVLPTTHFCSNLHGLASVMGDGVEWKFCDGIISQSTSDSYKYKLLTKKEISPLGAGILMVRKMTQTFASFPSGDEPCYIEQRWIQFSNGLCLSRITKEAKVEYSNNYILQQWKNQKENFYFESIVQNKNWGNWMIMNDDYYPLSVAPVQPNQPQAGLMLPEDKKKLDSINVEAINSADNSNVNTIKFCDVEKEILSKGADAPVGLYIDNTQINSALKIYRIFINEEPQNKSYRVEVIPLDSSISTPTPMKYSWQNNKWTRQMVAPLIAEPNSVTDQIFQLEGRIEKLESKIQK